MAPRSLFRNPLFGALIVRCNAVTIERDSADVKGVKNTIGRLRAGITRTRDGPLRAAVPLSRS
jgi:1-acyl-sn-glycerol-3-phosphate acyltransferase